MQLEASSATFLNLMGAGMGCTSLRGPVPTLDSVFEGLADYLEQHFEPGMLAALIA